MSMESVYIVEGSSQFVPIFFLPYLGRHFDGISFVESYDPGEVCRRDNGKHV